MNQDPEISGERVKAAWSELQRCLEDQKKLTYEELRSYPTPITACDQQFNYLLERLAQLCQELGRLRIAASSIPAVGDHKKVDEFLRSTACIDENSKQRVRSVLNDGLLARS